MPFMIANNVLNSTEGRVAVQITDLFPHKTQSSAVLTPNFQGPQYLYAHSRSLTEAVAVAANADNDIETSAEYSGLAAYILATIESAAGASLLVVTAGGIATDIIARMRAGQSLTETDINTIIDDLEPGAGLAVGDSFGSVLEILQIVSGYKVFTLPAGTIVEVAAGDFNDAVLAVAVDAGFSDPTDASSLFTKFYDSFYLSARSGQLKKAQTANLVVCYADDGSLIQ